MSMVLTFRISSDRIFEIVSENKSGVEGGKPVCHAPVRLFSIFVPADVYHFCDRMLSLFYGVCGRTVNVRVVTGACLSIMAAMVPLYMSTAQFVSSGRCFVSSNDRISSHIAAILTSL